MKKILFICLAMLLVSMSIARESPSEKHTEFLKENTDDFERVSLLKSVLDHCESLEINKDKNFWINVMIEYSQYIIKNNNISDDDVANIIVNSEFAVQNKFGESVPVNICQEAENKGIMLSNNWLEMKKRLAEKDMSYITKSQDTR